MSDPRPERDASLPSHPQTADASDADGSRTNGNRATVLVFALVAALVVVILVLHLTGVVGPAGHG